MSKRPVVTLSVAFGLAFPGAPAAPQEPGITAASDPRVESRTYAMPETGEEVPYAIFVPSAYDPSMEWPLIVALHGLGRPYDWVMGYEGYVDRADQDGYITVTPKGYHPRAWYGSRGPGVPRGADRDDPGSLPSNVGELGERDVIHVLDIVREEYNVDEDRIYLWGHSMGGAGTYHLAAKYPDLWAAVAVAAPAPSADPDQLESFRHIPVLAIHGDADSVVPVDLTRAWVSKMSELGMQHVYIEVAGGDHSSFINSSPEAISKLFSFFDIVRKDQLGGRH